MSVSNHRLVPWTGFLIWIQEKSRTIKKCLDLDSGGKIQTGSRSRPISNRTDDSANTLLYERGNPCMKDSDCDYYANSKCDTSCGLCKAPLNAVDPHKPPKN
uniref:ShKT domain-containing protein n=1 Tax=Meloidogyne incognita TaxID=6306 RepID=A0A914MQ06_MELIC